MPEIPTTRIRFMTEGMKYLLKLPLIVMSCLTGKAFIKPLSASIIVTNKCNLRCIHCHLSSGTALENEMTTEEIFRVIDEAKDLGVKRLIISGGEPLVRNDIMSIIEYASKHGNATFIF